MSDNNLNKKFFTEADSPVPLLPADVAWNNMQQKLDEPKKKRRFLIWMLPMAIAVLLTGVAAIIWWKPKTGAMPLVKIENKKEPVADSKRAGTNITTTDSKRADVVNEPGNSVTLIEKEKPDASTGKSNEQHNGIELNHTKRRKDLFKPIPTLTAQNKNKRTAQARQKSNEELLTYKENATAGEDERSLPFAFPERVLFTDAILVQAYQPLPASSFNKTPKENSTNKAVWVEAGLQWNVPAPVDGTDHYLTGPNGKAQPYQYLFPGIWLSVNKNKQRIIVSANPFVSAPLSDKYYEKAMVPLNDSISVYSQKKMVKMFGYQTSLQYDYQFAGHWRVGGGISANWWKKGLVYAQPADSIIYFKPFIYSVNTKEESAVTGFQMSANAAISYQFKACEAILQVNVPFTETIKNVQSPLWLRLGVRWRLLKK